jgi:hypothetical protein
MPPLEGGMKGDIKAQMAAATIRLTVQPSFSAE